MPSSEETCEAFKQVIMKAIDADSEHFIKVDAVSSAIYGENKFDCNFIFDMEQYHSDQREKSEQSLLRKLASKALSKRVNNMTYPRPVFESTVPRVQDILTSPGTFERRGTFMVRGVEIIQDPITEFFEKVVGSISVSPPVEMDKAPTPRRRSKPVQLDMEIVASEDEIREMKEKGLIEEAIELD